MVPGGSRRDENDTRSCQISYLGYTKRFYCNKSHLTDLNVTSECRLIQKIPRRFRRQEVVPGGSRKGENDTRSC